MNIEKNLTIFFPPLTKYKRLLASIGLSIPILFYQYKDPTFINKLCKYPFFILIIMFIMIFLICFFIDKIEIIKNYNKKLKEKIDSCTIISEEKINNILTLLNNKNINFKLEEPPSFVLTVDLKPIKYISISYTLQDFFYDISICILTSSQTQTINDIENNLYYKYQNKCQTEYIYSIYSNSDDNFKKSIGLLITYELIESNECNKINKLYLTILGKEIYKKLSLTK